MKMELICEIKNEENSKIVDAALEALEKANFKVTKRSVLMSHDVEIFEFEVN